MMKPVRHFRAGRLPRVIVMAAAIGAISAAPALAASSHAYGIEARFAVSGVSTGIGPLAVVSGTAPPSYSKTQSAGKISEIVDIVPGPLPGVSLILAVPYADGLKSHVAGGFGVDTISAEGDVTIKSASLNLITGSLIPQANRADVTLLFLGISATNVKSSAHCELIAPGLVTIGGAAKFGSLTIDGSLVGGQTIQFSGNAAANTVIYQSPTPLVPTGLNLAALQPLIALWYAPQVTIVLNRQVPEGVISCSATPAGCTFTPTGVKVEAIAVELHRVSLGGQLVSGTIVLGGQSAEQ